MSAERYAIAVLLSLFLFSSCQNNDSLHDLYGTWRITLTVEGNPLPFKALIVEKNGNPVFYAINGEERIMAELCQLTEDSFRVQLPVFDTELAGRIVSDSLISGLYYDHSRKGNYQIPFKAEKVSGTRFINVKKPTTDVNGKWHVEFSPGSDHQYQAIGVFSQDGNNASGTFLTTTGDYRYLAGNVSGDSLWLSCFDGSHVFLFKAKVQGDSIDGDFWSGTHWVENWSGVRDDRFELPDPDSLTFLKPGFQNVDFSFKNLKGETIGLSDDRYQNKVVVVQIMGSWCPNCKDETAYLVSLYNRFHGQGLEVISLAFEKSDNRETDLRSVKRLQEYFDVPYEILLAGKADKTDAAEKLPMLDHVLSFPTTIFIDRHGRVRRIHTGFSGPGTGEYYQEFVEETNSFVTQLLLE